MRIGFDVDGVLADFNTAFIERIKVETGRDLFPTGYVPTTWHYPETLGYTPDEVAQVWKRIEKDPMFWLSLSPYWDAMTILERLRVLTHEHDLYFVTSRPGLRAKQQTEVWLATHSGDFMWNPTVMISGDKGHVAKALKLDAYIDDRWENCADVIAATDMGGVPACYTFLLDRQWNRDKVHSYIIRVSSPAEMLDSLLAEAAA